MFEMLFTGAITVVGLVVLGLIWAIVSLVCWAFVLPFKVLGLAFKGIAFVLALPFLILFGIVAVLFFGFGAVLFLIPALPLLLLVWAVWWLATRNRTPRTA